MRRYAAAALLAILLVTSGCTLAEGVFWAGGNKYYSAGSDYDSRTQHFDAEHDRWKQYENEY